MDDRPELARQIRAIDRRGYKAYKRLEGSWSFPDFTLYVDHVQGDPFAAPSRLRAVVPAACAGFPDECTTNRRRRIAVACLLARRFAAAARTTGRRRGSGRSGAIAIAAPGQQVYDQTAAIVATDGTVEARFTVGLPARGRSVLAREAIELLCEDVPSLVERSLLASAHDAETVRRHWQAAEDAAALRAALPERGLVAFVADGAVLPRRSGVDDRPLRGAEVVPFASCPSLRHTIDTPHSGPVSGLGVPAGVTLIVGGGYHGKSTLLRALQLGIYDHRPDDGRERVVSLGTTTKVRAEDGRSVAGVDISPFIRDLPGGRSTTGFSTEDASGSTSQAAGLVEALDAGAEVLLIDEDTAATNFMIRDRRMQALVPREREPITPMIDRVRELYERFGLSSVLVIGGSGDYLDVADTVIAMEEFRPFDRTGAAREVARQFPTGRRAESAGPLRLGGGRAPQRRSLDASKGRRDVHVRASGRWAIQFGQRTIDIGALEQIVAREQTEAIAAALVHALRGHVDDRRSLRAIVDAVDRDVAERGLDVLDRRRVGDLAAFRSIELAAAFNRLRGFGVADGDRPSPRQ